MAVGGNKTWNVRFESLKSWLSWVWALYSLWWFGVPLFWLTPNSSSNKWTPSSAWTHWPGNRERNNHTWSALLISLMMEVRSLPPSNQNTDSIHPPGCVLLHQKGWNPGWIRLHPVCWLSSEEHKVVASKWFPEETCFAKSSSNLEHVKKTHPKFGV